VTLEGPKHDFHVPNDKIINFFIFRPDFEKRGHYFYFFMKIPLLLKNMEDFSYLCHSSYKKKKKDIKK